MSNIAIIGGGIFGTVGALELSKAGHKVTLFEKENSLLSKATENSQNRLHLGLHYPRDLDTAKQSVLGFRSFLARYRDSVDFDFPNYYALAVNESRTNLSNFLTFADEAQIEIKEVDPNELKYLGLREEDYSGVWICEEGVIDIPTLKLRIGEEIRQSSVKVLTNTEIKIAKLDENWLLLDDQGYKYEFDSVFRCTYGSDRIEINAAQVSERSYEFHKTAILNVNLKAARFGFTIIDGDFLTILPDGKSNRSLIYAPSISTLLKNEGQNYPIEWDDLKPSEQSKFTRDLVHRTHNWLPGVQFESINRIMLAVRSIQPNLSSTDRRTSSISETAPNFYDIWSGKIDHCVDLSSHMLDLV